MMNFLDADSPSEREEGCHEWKVTKEVGRCSYRKFDRMGWIPKGYGD